MVGKNFVLSLIIPELSYPVVPGVASFAAVDGVAAFDGVAAVDGVADFDRAAAFDLKIASCLHLL